MDNRIDTLCREVREELTGNILPYWMHQMVDTERGGFYGQRTGVETLVTDAPKGAILNARILWTFSSAYRLLHDPAYLETATRAKRYLIDHFYDAQYGGVYWSLDADGKPLDTKKQIYALGFAIYGLSEYARATGDDEALHYAVELFHQIEKHSFDNQKNGYCEALTRDWQPIADMRLSAKDANEKKTMNTHLHILEPYTNLYRVWPTAELRGKLSNLIDLFTDVIYDARTGHLQLFFDDDWHNKYNIVSYGHDIEASWLLYEAASVLGDASKMQKVRPIVVDIARAAGEGYIPSGGMIYEFHADSGALDADRHWWVQAETVVGYLNLYQHFADNEALDLALETWSFIQQHIIDREAGEWHWSLKATGEVNRTDDKAGFWKCPYHNGRMCMEVLERFSTFNF